ncbi:nucleoside-diphosphate sugar epimerase/dehydratase [Galbibacter sp. EGI 63066]|uniref:polysaccharide biosynthesis protein n=1 Tax=Galbibacter sp. EGI 63066 TaxID=2993559 RepID=UPI0022490527|nr:nucleoside-diphosphate sugar epimerase/dehydratase [Galbibacter sp. EGI 63066]MCX2679160.1 nucleoside-diphosphate sugar epimerase/dehydratase [Galbibacter sp. EGI 63066]
MIYKYLMPVAARHASKWIVLSVDILLVLMTFVMVYFIRFHLTFNFNVEHLWMELPIIAILAFTSFMLTGSYKGIIRYTGVKDLMNIFMAVCVLTVLTSAFVVANKELALIPSLTIPKSIIIMHAFLNFVVLALSRLTFKILYRYVHCKLKATKRILIYGAGEAGIMTHDALVNSVDKKNKVIAFIDDDKHKIGNSINGTKIMERSYVDEAFIKKNRIDEIIVSIQNTSSSKFRESIERLIDYETEIKIVPPIDKWMNGELNVNEIKPLQLEDLLDRTPICIENEGLCKEFSNKVLLVTGAAGSIGSEISRQLVKFNFKKLVLIDIAESALYDLQQELKQAGIKNFHPIVTDVRDQHGLERIFEVHQPDIIFHAAAYKHVPLMEDQPYEAVKVNVGGTRLLAKMALKHQADKFVFVSTDKAVNPTNVMGATKRAAEIYIGSLQEKSTKTKFITTRFGNVLGSNGSVIPLFKKQLEKGGPLTVTHEEVTRYFMTIPEASQLVLEAGTMGKGGEIFIFDMGESVKIMDLAKNMIRLSGLRYPEDIDIKITGLRPGEKLYEELLANGENTLPTYHEKIMISKVKEMNYEKLRGKIDALCVLNLFHDKNVVVKKLKEIVPEFVSKNSSYEHLDQIEKARTPNYNILQSLNYVSQNYNF